MTDHRRLRYSALVLIAFVLAASPVRATGPEAVGFGRRWLDLWSWFLPKILADSPAPKIGFAVLPDGVSRDPNGALPPTPPLLAATEDADPASDH